MVLPPSTTGNIRELQKIAKDARSLEDWYDCGGVPLFPAPPCLDYVGFGRIIVPS